MKQWGIFCLYEELNETRELIEDTGLTIFECRKLSGFEKVMYLGIEYVSSDMWIIMFEASYEQYETIISRNQMIKVF